MKKRVYKASGIILSTVLMSSMLAAMSTVAWFGQAHLPSNADRRQWFQWIFEGSFANQIFHGSQSEQASEGNHAISEQSG
ncbi:hypothetical protein GCM10008018_55700 [Paenibacillus marchantiophytorum]|uniref:Uncharacterized protein n=1 Tax=Paenibacillus marchantiophytorum TaxID=1619310 RepID=A0ABQ1F8M6_9BACL|nr:hypothetical protein GCM10008018_55700 [Paenibacillus marchantiophytorum]